MCLGVCLIFSFNSASVCSYCRRLPSKSDFFFSHLRWDFGFCESSCRVSSQSGHGGRRAWPVRIASDSRADASGIHHLGGVRQWFAAVLCKLIQRKVFHHVAEEVFLHHREKSPAAKAYAPPRKRADQADLMSAVVSLRTSRSHSAWAVYHSTANSARDMERVSRWAWRRSAWRTIPGPRFARMFVVRDASDPVLPPHLAEESGL